MSASMLRLWQQRRALEALGRVALRALAGAGDVDAPAPAASEAGRWIEERVQGPSPSLARAFVAASGGDAAWYRGRAPWTMFAQWTFATLSRAMRELPWPVVRVLNQGVSVAHARAIPAGETLVVRARLASIERDERRAKIITEVETGPLSDPSALVAKVHAYLPLGKHAPSAARVARDEPDRPTDARELARWSLTRDAGRDFALLTGDVNPIHWLAPAARLAGFRAPILHGFATLARAVEALNRGVFVGDPSRLRSLEARFLRPLVLPARVSLYAARDARACWVADGPSGPPYLSVRYELSP